MYFHIHTVVGVILHIIQTGLFINVIAPEDNKMVLLDDEQIKLKIEKKTYRHFNF